MNNVCDVTSIGDDAFQSTSTLCDGWNHWADRQAVADAGAQSTSPHQVGYVALSLT